MIRGMPMITASSALRVRLSTIWPPLDLQSNSPSLRLAPDEDESSLIELSLGVSITGEMGATAREEESEASMRLRADDISEL